jgi:hypothetical protein
MALDYLSIPGKCVTVYSDLISPIYLATSVDVERVFSRGRIIITHLQNQLSAQTTRSLLCLNYWSLAGLVKDKDVLKVTRNNKAVDGSADVDLEDGWDVIVKLGD